MCHQSDSRSRDSIGSQGAVLLSPEAARELFSVFAASERLREARQEDVGLEHLRGLVESPAPSRTGTLVARRLDRARRPLAGPPAVVFLPGGEPISAPRVFFRFFVTIEPRGALQYMRRGVRAFFGAPAR